MLGIRTEAETSIPAASTTSSAYLSKPSAHASRFATALPPPEGNPMMHMTTEHAPALAAAVQ